MRSTERHRFMMGGATPVGVLCCVLHMLVTHTNGLGCPVIKNRKGPSAPVFTNASTPDDVMVYGKGQPYTLKCCIRGHPKPNITWLKDNRPLSSVQRTELVNDNQELSISRVRLRDSGEYICIAKNIHGATNHTIYMDIRKQIVDRNNSPKLALDTPWLAVVGSNITLRCRVSSIYRPSVIWFKLNGTRHRFIRSDPITNTEISDEYVSTLTITNVSFDDAGVYKCQAKSGIGATAPEKKANLTVVERKEFLPSPEVVSQGNTFPHKYLTLAVGGGLVLLVVILSVVTAVYIKRHKPDGWVTRKLIQMGVVNPPKCHANTHGEDGDDECICHITWDVFVSYNNKDREWVMNVLHEELSKEYKVCIDYQNFIPGGGVVDNIARCIWRSNTTLFVVSRDFLRSGWSKMEFEITQDKIRQTQGSLIVIMLEDIKWQELPPILRRYTTGKMRVDCKNKELQHRTWCRLKSLLGPSIASNEKAVAKEVVLTVHREEVCLLIMETSL